MPQEPFMWEVERSPYASQFLKETKQFGERNRVYLIDQYDGKRPTLLNAQFFANGTIEFGMGASAVLDSNLVDAIDSRVSKGPTSDGLESFLRFVTEHRWDFSPEFYYFEHWAKSPRADFAPNAIRRTASLLQLHSMDENRFLKNGEIVPDPEAIEYYQTKTGATTLPEMAEQRVNAFINKYERRLFSAMAEVAQIALTKMVLLHKFEQPKASPAAKYNALVDFLRNDVGVLLGREEHFALHYFCDQAGSLLGIQSNTHVDNALRTVRSTAWDLLLLRFPEILFSQPSPTEVMVGYVATQEKRLQELGRLFVVERIVNDGVSGIVPAVSYNSASIPASVLAEIPPNADTHRKQRHGDDRSLTVPVGLLSALERELARHLASAGSRATETELTE